MVKSLITRQLLKKIKEKVNFSNKNKNKTSTKENKANYEKNYKMKNEKCEIANY